MASNSMGELIATLRREKGMTQKELADMLNITDKAVSKWERNITYPDTQTIPKLAEIFDVSIEDLLMAKLPPADIQKSPTCLIDFTKSIHYAIYLVTMGLVLALGAVSDIMLFPTLYISINFMNIINFLDFVDLGFIFVVCLITLLCTRSARPLKDAFVIALCKGDYTAEQYENSLLSVKLTMLSAFAAGCIMFLISVVNILKSMDMTSGYSMLGNELSAGLIAPIYSLVIAFILLPVYAELKRSLSAKIDNK